MIAGNSQHGIYSLAVGANRSTVNAFDNLITDSGVDGVRSDGAAARIRISENEIVGNLGFGLRPLNGGQIISWSNNRIVDNAVDGAPTGTLSPK